MKITLGQRIRELRQAKDLSLREFAKRLGEEGATAPYLSDIELGRRHPSEGLMAKMARVLGVAVDELRALDPRPPVDQLRRLGEKDPELAVALRRVVDQKVSGDELTALLEKLRSKKKGERA